jgi:hypothetical protein
MGAGSSQEQGVAPSACPYLKENLMDIIIHEHEITVGEQMAKSIPMFDLANYLGLIVIQRRAEQNEKNNRDKCKLHGNNPNGEL